MWLRVLEQEALNFRTTIEHGLTNSPIASLASTRCPTSVLLGMCARLGAVQTRIHRAQAACQDDKSYTGQMATLAGHALLTRSMPSLVKAAWRTL